MSSRYSELYSLDHLRKFYPRVGELDDAVAVAVDCIFNVSLILVSKRFYSGVTDPLEFYVDTGLVSPVTKLVQMQQLLPLKEIRETNYDGTSFNLSATP